MISPNDAEHLLTGLLSPEEISDIMSDVTGNSNQSIWHRLSGVSEALFAGYLMQGTSANGLRHPVKSDTGLRGESHGALAA